MVDASLLELLVKYNIDCCDDLLWRNGFSTLEEFSKLKVKQIHIIGFDNKYLVPLLTASQEIADKLGSGCSPSDYEELKQICKKRDVTYVFKILPKYGIRTVSDLRSSARIMDSLGIPEKDEIRGIIEKLSFWVPDDVDHYTLYPEVSIKETSPSSNTSDTPDRISSEESESHDDKEKNVELSTSKKSFCPYCGNKVAEDGAKFCSNCGKRLEGKNRILPSISGFFKREKKKKREPFSVYRVKFEVGRTLTIPKVCPVCLAQSNLEPMYLKTDQVYYTRGIFTHRNTIYKKTRSINPLFYVCARHMQSVLDGYVRVHLYDSEITYSFLNGSYAKLFSSINQLELKEKVYH